MPSRERTTPGMAITTPNWEKHNIPWYVQRTNYNLVFKAVAATCFWDAKECISFELWHNFCWITIHEFAEITVGLIFFCKFHLTLSLAVQVACHLYCKLVIHTASNNSCSRELEMRLLLKCVKSRKTAVDNKQKVVYCFTYFATALVTFGLCSHLQLRVHWCSNISVPARGCPPTSAPWQPSGRWAQTAPAAQS